LQNSRTEFSGLLDSDGSTLKAWQGRILPSRFPVEAEGRIRYRIVGPMDWDSGEVLATIEKIIPDIQSTQIERPLSGTIKEAQINY
jgi:hypothetical protein